MFTRRQKYVVKSPQRLIDAVTEVRARAVTSEGR
jgi:hypothetical protein